MSKRHKIFIAHSHDHDRVQFQELLALLSGYPRFDFSDLSYPDARRIEGKSEERLKSIIRRSIRQADVVLVLGRPAVNGSDWIKFELDVATRLGKRIVGIVPRGGTYLASLVRGCASQVVQWDAAEIVRCIRDPSFEPSKHQAVASDELPGRVARTAPSVPIQEFAVSSAEPIGPAPKEQIAATRERSRLRALFSWWLDRQKGGKPAHLD